MFCSSVTTVRLEKNQFNTKTNTYLLQFKYYCCIKSSLEFFPKEFCEFSGFLSTLQNFDKKIWKTANKYDMEGADCICIPFLNSHLWTLQMKEEFFKNSDQISFRKAAEFILFDMCNGFWRQCNTDREPWLD